MQANFDQHVSSRIFCATLRTSLDLMTPMANRRSRVIFSPPRRGTDSTAVFIVVPIDDVVTAILNGPVATIYVEDTLWVSLVHRSVMS